METVPGTEGTGTQTSPAAGLEEMDDKIRQAMPDLTDAQIAELKANGEVVGDVCGIPSAVHLNRYPNGVAPTAQLKADRIVAAQPGLLPDDTVEKLVQRFGSVGSLPATSAPDAVSRIVAQIQQLKGRDPQGSKSLVVVDPEMAARLEVALAEIDPTWRELPVLIVGVASGSLDATDPDALLAYLLDLLEQADSLPGRRIEFLEATFTIELEDATYFLRSSA